MEAKPAEHKGESSLETISPHNFYNPFSNKLPIKRSRKRKTRKNKTLASEFKDWQKYPKGCTIKIPTARPNKEGLVLKLVHCRSLFYSVYKLLLRYALMKWKSSS